MHARQHPNLESNKKYIGLKFHWTSLTGDEIPQLRALSDTYKKTTKRGANNDDVRTNIRRAQDINRAHKKQNK
jgi:hypothetical protein